MQVHCPYDQMVSIKDLKPNPKNRNSHPDDQIERLAKILEYQGFRYPVKVSKQSGFIVSGHGRLLAAKKLGLSEVPVSFQDYESEEQEYADAISDNSIASWSELDLSGINTDVPDLGPDFDIDLLGIRDFVVDVNEAEMPALPIGDKSPIQQVTFTLHSDQAEIVNRALAIAKGMGEFVDTMNENGNGNALARVCEIFIGDHENR